MSGHPTVPSASGVQNLPAGYVSYLYMAFNPKTHHVIYSNDQKAWFDETGNPVPATAAKKK